MSRLAVLALAAAGLCATPVSSQVAISATAGLHVASFDSDADLAESARLRAVGGVTARVMPSRFVGGQVEVLYAQKGSQIEDGSLRYRTDYVEVPILLALKLPLVRLLDTSLLVGPAVAIPIGGTVEADAIGPAPASEVDLNLQNDIGAVVGAEVGAGPFGVGLRYTHGLRNVIEGENVVEWRHRVVAVTAHYRLNP